MAPCFLLRIADFLSSGLDVDSTTSVITQQCILEEADSTVPIFGAVFLVRGVKA